MLGGMLGCHSQCVCTPESQFIEHLLARGDSDDGALDPRHILSQIAADERYRLLWDLPLDVGRVDAAELGDGYPQVLSWLVRAYGRKLGKTAAAMWVDHTPTNFRRGRTLLRMFPDARFIHLVRDGRAVAASLLPLDWGPNNVVDAAEFWMARCAGGLAAEVEWGPDRVLRVRYEDVLADPETSLRRIASFAGLDYEEGMTSGAGQRPTPYHEQQHRLVGNAPDPSRVSGWQQVLTGREVEVFEGEAGEFLEMLSYHPRYGIRARPASRVEVFRMRVGDLARRARNNLQRWRRAKRTITAACFSLALLAAAQACKSAGQPRGVTPASPSSAPVLSLQHGTLINPGERPIPNASVTVGNGRISCAGTMTACPRPAGSTAIDLTGAYIAPGLIDAHVHYSQTGWVDGRPDALDLRAQYPYDSVIGALEDNPEHFHRANLCSGVTTVFDVGGFPWTYALARRTRPATNAPRVVATGPLLATIEVDSQEMGQFALMRDESTVRDAVRQHRAAGAEAVKVWYIQVADSLRPHAKAMLMAAGDETRKLGLRLVVHATELSSAREAVEAGAAVLVHEVFSDTLDPPFIAALKQHGTIVIPTLSVLDGYADVFLGRSPARRYPLACVDHDTRRKLETVIPDSLRNQGGGFWKGPGAVLRATAAANLKRMHAAGIPVAMGTDAGNPGTAHGPSVYAEMEAMQQAGMPAGAVFVSSTIVAARALALDRDVGSIAPGKRADLVIFDADPTRDIHNARQVRYVVRNGALYSQHDLLPP